MPLRIPRSLVEFILLGPEDDRRQLQDSPILGDVWVEFAKQPAARLELLITPFKEQAAGKAAKKLREMIPSRTDTSSNVAYLQGVIAASLTFSELIRYVVPLTHWWSEDRIVAAMKDYLTSEKKLVQALQATRAEAEKWLLEIAEPSLRDLEARRRFSSLTALILWAASEPDDEDVKRTTREQARIVVERMKGNEAAMVKKLTSLFRHVPPKLDEPFVWTVAMNRRATPALTRSVPAVKADAAATLFTVDCSSIVWAVLDSGIDATHYAFRSAKEDPRTKKHRSRVVRTFDFTAIREIVTLDNLVKPHRARRARDIAARKLRNPMTPAAVDKTLRDLAERADEGLSVNWQLVEQLVELDPATNPPATNHGTHVAGILAASKDGAARAVKADRAKLDVSTKDWADGMCPDIQLYDLRVLAPTLRETEFAIIAALQYVRFVNERNSYLTIHGANVSLSIPHDVRNYACGRTPVCNECERLVNSGVVVVAAAGNRGYQNFETTEGLYEGYAAFSVTDPGNADGVITVGSTHRFWPHTYGVSFFSSRGPTGDGRLKPDLVAPGERIRAPIVGDKWGDLDGTSMAAPHVSGAAAMLMARYSELVGQPRRIKSILCDSATDLGRERSFQGKGMLDVLRAFQSI